MTDEFVTLNSIPIPEELKNQDLEVMKLTFAPIVKLVLDRAQAYGISKKFVPDLAIGLGLLISFFAYFSGSGSLISAIGYGFGIGVGAIGYNSAAKRSRSISN